jgi:hypothetical protein
MISSQGGMGRKLSSGDEMKPRMVASTRKRLFTRLGTALAALPAVLALSALSALGTSCGEGRFPVCKSDAECAEKVGDAGTGPKVCYNLRCVECRYDTDCAVGKACNRNLNECQDIGGVSVAEEDAGASGGASAWDPANWDECAKRCKDQDCIKQCDQRFRK